MKWKNIVDSLPVYDRAMMAAALGDWNAAPEAARREVLEKYAGAWAVWGAKAFSGTLVGPDLRAGADRVGDAVESLYCLLRRVEYLSAQWFPQVDTAPPTGIMEALCQRAQEAAGMEAAWGKVWVQAVIWVLQAHDMGACIPAKGEEPALDSARKLRGTVPLMDLNESIMAMACLADQVRMARANR